MRNIRELLGWVVDYSTDMHNIHWMDDVIEKVCTYTVHLQPI